MFLTNKRIPVVVSINLIALTLYTIHTPLSLIINSEITALSTPFPLDVTLGSGLIILAITGMDYVLSLNRTPSPLPFGYKIASSLAAGLVMLLAGQLLLLPLTLPAWGLGLGLTGVLLWLIIGMQLRHLANNITTIEPKAWWHQLLEYGLFLALMITLTNAANVAWIKVIMVVIVTFLAALSFLCHNPSLNHKIWLYALTTSLLMGQLAWILIYGQFDFIPTALFLFLFFYLLTSLTRQQLLGRLSYPIILEFGAVAAVILLLIFNLSRLQM